MMKVIFIVLISIACLSVAQYFPRFPFYIPFFNQPPYIPGSRFQPQIPPLPPSVHTPPETPPSTPTPPPVRPSETSPASTTPPEPTPPPTPTTTSPPIAAYPGAPPPASSPPPASTQPPASTPPPVQPHTRPPAPQTGDEIICTIAVLDPIEGRGNAHGIVHIINYNDTHTLVKGNFAGFEPNTAHAFHMHLFGDMSDPFGAKTGDKFDRSGQPHGCPGVTPYYNDGDLGNIFVEEDGSALFKYYTNRFRAADSIGRALITHERIDNCRSPATYGDRISKGAIGICSDITIHQISNEFQTPPRLGPPQSLGHQHGPGSQVTPQPTPTYTQPTQPVPSTRPTQLGYSVPSY